MRRFAFLRGMVIGSVLGRHACLPIPANLVLVRWFRRSAIEGAFDRITSRPGPSDFYELTIFRQMLAGGRHFHGARLSVLEYIC